jgi:hypothetical protein
MEDALAMMELSAEVTAGLSAPAGNGDPLTHESPEPPQACICNTTGIQNTMKLNYKSGLLAVLCIAWICLTTGCEKGTKNESDGSVRVANGDGACNVYIVEKDGYRFAVAVGYNKCAITQIK